MTDDDRVSYLEGDDVDLDASIEAELAETKELLDDPSIWEEPPTSLEDDVVTAVLREANRMPGVPADSPSRVSEVPATARSDRRSAPRSDAPRRRRWAAAAVAGAAAVVIVLVASALWSTLRSDGDDSQYVAALSETEELPGAAGEATFTRTDSGWEIVLDAPGLPRLDDGRYYQAWLKGPDDITVPIGTFNEGDDVVLWAGVSPADFPTITVTREAADGNQASSGIVVLAGDIAER